MKTQGYNVLIIPEDIQKDEQKALKKAQREQIIAEGKDVAQKILEEQAAKAIEWLKDKEHQELVIKYGKLIAQAVITKKIPKK